MALIPHVLSFLQGTFLTCNLFMVSSLLQPPVPSKAAVDEQWPLISAFFYVAKWKGREKAGEALNWSVNMYRPISRGELPSQIPGVNSPLLLFLFNSQTAFPVSCDSLWESFETGREKPLFPICSHIKAVWRRQKGIQFSQLSSCSRCQSTELVCHQPWRGKVCSQKPLKETTLLV